MFRPAGTRLSGGRRRSEVAAATLENLQRVDAKSYLYTLAHSKTNQAGAEWMRRLDPASVTPPPGFPFVLSAGQRRLQNANQILRDPAAKRADPDGAMYIHPQDLADLGIADQGYMVVESRHARLVVRAHATDSMRRGHVILPHGYGQSHPDETGRRVLRGPALNWLTDATHRDPIADTPFHKFVPVHLAAAKPGAVVGTVETLP